MKEQQPVVAATEEQAIDILGSDKVLTQWEIDAVFGGQPPYEHAHIRYSAETLHQVAQLNRSLGMDFRLVYISDGSMTNLRRVQVDFFRKRAYRSWEQLSAEQESARCPILPTSYPGGYYLMSLMGLNEHTWVQQERMIEVMPKYERLPATLAVLGVGVLIQAGKLPDNFGLAHWSELIRTVDKVPCRAVISDFGYPKVRFQYEFWSQESPGNKFVHAFTLRQYDL